MEEKVSRMELAFKYKSIHVQKPLQRERLCYTVTQRAHTYTLLALLQAFSYRAPHEGQVHLIFIQAHTHSETTDACTCLKGLSATWTQTHERCTHKGPGPGWVAQMVRTWYPYAKDMVPSLVRGESTNEYMNEWDNKSMFFSLPLLLKGGWP